MKTNQKILLFLIASSLVFGLFFSCEHVAAVADIGAQAASAAGVIDPTIAAGISQSAQAIGRAAEEFTPEQEYYIGRAVAANILTTYNVWNGNPALTAYLNRICLTIAINSPKPDIFIGYRVNILDTNEINAFATPGGHIFITRGLIDCAESEDALAGIIAHEIAHIQLQHGIISIRNNRRLQAAVATADSFAGVFSGMEIGELTRIFDGAVGELVNTLVVSGYSQRQEFDADATALSLMASAGYDPNALILMIRVLERNQERNRGFGRTHPTPAQRISNVQRSVNQYQVTDTRSHREDRFRAAVR